MLFSQCRGESFVAKVNWQAGGAGEPLAELPRSAGLFAFVAAEMHGQADDDSNGGILFSELLKVVTVVMSLSEFHRLSSTLV